MIHSLKFENAAHLINRKLPPRRVILAPWLNSEETCVVWAPSGVGKTMFSLSLAVAVAGGGQLGEWDAPEPKKVLYVDGEMNIRDLRERTDMIMHSKGVLCGPEQIDHAGQNLVFVVRQDQEDTDFYDITNPEHQGLLVERVKAGGFELVIFDNFTTLSKGLDDENDHCLQAASGALHGAEKDWCCHRPDPSCQQRRQSDAGVYRS